MREIINEVSFTKEYIEEQARLALAQWGYECTVEVETQDILCVTVFSKDGVELTGKCNMFRFCADSALTRSPHTGRHRKNYYEWHEGLVKFASESFWLTRSNRFEPRGACSESTKDRQNLYNSTHRQEMVNCSRRHYALYRDELLSRQAQYAEEHREEIISYQKQYRDSHREELKIKRKHKETQLWTNGTETLKWSTLQNRGHKADILAQGWHSIE